MISAPPLLIPVPLIVTASAPMAWPLRSRTAPELIVVAPAVVPSAEALPSFSRPTARTVIAPERSLAPDRISTSGPATSNVPDPVTTPESVSSVVPPVPSSTSTRPPPEAIVTPRFELAVAPRYRSWPPLPTVTLPVPIGLFRPLLLMLSMTM